MRRPSLGIVVLLAGCGPGATSYEVTAAVRMEGRARLSVDGQVVGEFANGDRLAFSAKAPILTRRSGQGISAEFLTPDGWVPARSATFLSRSRSWEDEEIRAGRPLRLDLEVLPPAQAFEDRFSLVLDNRDGEAAQVSVGALTLEAPAGAVVVRELPCPRGPAGEIVRVGNREHGRVAPGEELRAQRQRTGSAQTGLAWWLVDLKGGRRYRTRQVTYVRQGATPPDRIAAPVTLEPAPIHALGFQGDVSLFRPASGVRMTETPWAYCLEVLEAP